MGTVISIYSRTAFREFILPAVDDTDHVLLLRRQYFNIRKDLRLRLEVLSGVWYISSSDDYTVSGLEAEEGRYRLISDKLVHIKDREGEDFTLMSRQLEYTYNSFTKYSLEGHDRVTIGRSASNDICYDQLGLVSKMHAALELKGGRWSISNSSRNGIYINSQRILKTRELKYGDYINIIGLHIVFLGNIIAVDDSSRDVKVSSELKEYVPSSKDTAGSPQQRTPVSRAFDAGEPDTRDVVIEQPVLTVSGWKEVYEGYLGKKGKELKDLFAVNRKYLSEAYPSSSDCMADSGRSLPFWHREPGDGDFLRVRIGTGSVESFNRIITDEEKLYLTDKDIYRKVTEMIRRYSTIDDAPVTADLAGKNSITICGSDPGSRTAMAENIAVQLAQHVSPAKLKLAFIFNGMQEEGPVWDELRWIPHVWAEDMSCRFFASDREEAGEAVYKLSRVILSREDMLRDAIDDLPHYVVFISDMRYIAGSLLEKYMHQKQYLGVTVVLMSDDAPQGAGSYIKISPVSDKGGDFDVSYCGEDAVSDFDSEGFDRKTLSDYARKLAAAADEESLGIAIIPDFVSLFDALDIKSAGDIRIAERWAKNRTYNHIKGVIGTGKGGMTRDLDLHERYNGPHALIAGTTGSGKSELLLSYLLSLSLEYSPEDLNLILIDFKGGGMANALEGLPHIAGCITNLSGGEADRAMLAVKSEIIRRQRLLNEYGINHIDEYVRLYKNKGVNSPMPHLLIVVDEFAELRREKPEFLDELISVAQTGRSLGIHLILATQRPRGNVDDNIRSNMRSVICLRVQDRRDSIDVLDRPDAAYLTGAGRAYLEVGAGEIFEPFQAAFSGRSRISEEKNRNKAVMLTPGGKADIVGAFNESGSTEQVSQLELIKSEIIKTADAEGISASRLWLDPLSRNIRLSDVLKIKIPDEGKSGIGIKIGMVDDPGERAQYPLALNIPGSGNIAVVGMPSSGKSTLIGTLMASLSDSGEADDIIVYGIDLDSGAMKEYRDEPFVEEIVDDRDVLGIEELLDDVRNVIDERKKLKKTDPKVLVVIDSYEDLRNTAGYRLESKIADMMREASGAGVYFIITGGGFGIGQISGTVEQNVNTVLSLNQKNKYEYMDVLHTTDISTMPDDGTKGRGLMVSHGRTLEFQIASDDLEDK